jgi:hypothetical protein
MQFTSDQIDIAKTLKQLGLPWEPHVGHYVYDANRICPKSSPFQDRVYFVLNFDCFMQHVGGIARFRDNMVWLPTWYDARGILRGLGVADAEVARIAADGVLQGDELTRIYELILETLSDTVVGSTAAVVSQQDDD